MHSFFVVFILKRIDIKGFWTINDFADYTINIPFKENLVRVIYLTQMNVRNFYTIDESNIKAT